MTTTDQTLDPAIAVDVAIRSGVSRREALRKAAMYSAALAASPLALAALSKEVYAQALPTAVQDVLRFALTLEHLEYEFYAQGVGTAGLIAAGETSLFSTIRDHEGDHVRFLQTALGLTPGVGPGSAGRPANGFDFTGAPGGLALDTFTNYQTFLAVAQGLEDTGVRAYKGQAANLIPVDAILQAALQIHSVEARHASAVRRIRGQKGWIPNNDRGGLPAAFQGIYDGEQNVTQGGVNLQTALTAYSATQITEAFDETLTKEQVLPIAGVFIRP
ncbi:MAG TPA: ferritin-like domain-containing protein [Rubricoccaceae bacterium]|jgi:hypothetical protein